MDAGDAARLGARYGSRFPELLAASAGHGERFVDGGAASDGPATILEAEVAHAMRAELARHLDDVLLRRLGLWTDRRLALRAAEPVSRWMARTGGWTESQRQIEVKRLETLFQAEDMLLAEALP